MPVADPQASGIAAGHGEVGPGGGPAGDLYVELDVNQHEVFQRDGDNLEMVLRIPMTAAALGTEIRVETLEADLDDADEDAASTTITVPPGTQSGTGDGRWRFFRSLMVQPLVLTGA